MMNKKYVTKQYNREAKAQKKQDLQELISQLAEVFNQKMNDQILQPQEILLLCEDFYTLFSIKREAIQITDELVEIIDLKLAADPDDEDKIFSSSQVIHQNFRRGLSFLKHRDEFLYLRKGMKKFFDIHSNWINNIDQIDESDSSNSQLYNYTLKDVVSHLEQNSSIKLLVYEKANGENAQISFVTQMDCWVISSKNTSILCQRREDLKKYTDSRYNLVNEIALEWFRLSDLFSVAQITLIKQQLSQSTLVGEYCGNPQYQHLVKYQGIQLKFFSMVNKYDTLTCQNIEVTRKLLSDLGLQQVNCRREIVVHQISELKQELQNLSNYIKEQNIDQEGEGVVIYFVNQKNECLSLAKLKTLDYKIHRQIREALRDCIQQKGNPVKAFQAFSSNLAKSTTLDQAKQKIYLDYSTKLLQEAQKFMKCQPEQNMKSVQQAINRLIDKNYLKIKETILSKQPGDNNVFQQLLI